VIADANFALASAISPDLIVQAIQLCLSVLPDAAVILTRVAAVVEFEDGAQILFAVIGARENAPSQAIFCSNRAAWITAAATALIGFIVAISNHTDDREAFAGRLLAAGRPSTVTQDEVYAWCALCHSVGGRDNPVNRAALEKWLGPWADRVLYIDTSVRWEFRSEMTAPDLK
jgi:hypothetical protein